MKDVSTGCDDYQWCPWPLNGPSWIVMCLTTPWPKPEPKPRPKPPPNPDWPSGRATGLEMRVGLLPSTIFGIGRKNGSLSKVNPISGIGSKKAGDLTEPRPKPPPKPPKLMPPPCGSSANAVDIHIHKINWK